MFATLVEVLDYKPALEIISLAAPIGLLDEYRRGGRSCDKEARRLLGWRRGAGVMSAPPRPALTAPNETMPAVATGISAVAWLQLAKVREVASEIQPYLQRTVFEVHPDLSFFQLNDDQPLLYSKRSTLGRKERTELLEVRLPGVDRILDAHPGRARAWHLLDAAACLWTSRRIAARAAIRIPADPEWDAEGLRMEIVR